VQRELTKRFGNRVPQKGLAIGKDVFNTKAELFKYLDEKALTKEGL